MKNRICFFDLETRHTFEDLKSGYSTLSWDQKEALRTKLIPKMGLATSCVISTDKKAYLFDEGQETDLVKMLDDHDTIVGHNVLRFDYLVLAGSIKSDMIKRLASKTVDTWDAINKATDRYISLDNLAKSNGLKLQKTLDGSKAPELWRGGRKDEVRKYCENDVRILMAIYELGKKKGKIKCELLDAYTGISTIEDIQIDW